MNKKISIEMNEWFSAKDLAGLPGMEQTERGVHAAMSKAINKRNKPRGRGIEYRLSDLPFETQAYILKANVVNK